MDAATFATAYGLSTSAGIRPFMTLAFASLAMHFGYLHPAHAFASLGSQGATFLLAGLAVLEFVADKIPGVDHVLHVVHFALKPVVAAILVGGTLPEDGLVSDVSMGVAALDAIGVHAGIATMRGASTSLSLGMANPVLSMLEDVAAIVGASLAIVLPFVGASLALAVTLAVFFVARAVWREVRKPRGAVTMAR